MRPLSTFSTVPTHPNGSDDVQPRQLACSNRKRNHSLNKLGNDQRIGKHSAEQPGVPAIDPVDVEPQLPADRFFDPALVQGVGGVSTQLYDSKTWDSLLAESETFAGADFLGPFAELERDPVTWKRTRSS